MAKGRPRQKRGIDKVEILDAAFKLYSEVGEDAFSVRKVGQTIGVDPMTVLHHFKSKNELLRQIADRALATVKLPKPSGCWRTDLKGIAYAYRDLAHRHPNAFHLHFRYHATGPADHESSEIVYQALLTVGIPPMTAAGLGLSFYSFVMGFGLAEVEGQLRAITDEDEAELLSLDPVASQATRKLIPSLKTLDPDQAFETSIAAFIEGVALLGRPLRAEVKAPKAKPSVRVLGASRR